MKFRSIILTALAAVAVFASCQKPEEPLKTPSISLDPATLTVAEAGATETVALTATRAWKVEGTLPAWITITPDRGDGSNDAQPLTVTVAKNEGGNRATSIKFTIGLFDATLKVEQAGPKGDNTISIAEFLQKKDSENEYVVKGTVSGLAWKNPDSSYQGFDLVDATGMLPCAFPTNMDEFKEQLADGKTVTIRGKYNLYQKPGRPDKEQMKNGFIVKVEEAAEVTVEGVVYAASTRSLVVKTSEGISYLFNNDSKAAEAKVGDQIKAVGLNSFHNGVTQLVGYELEILGHDKPVDRGTPETLTTEQFDNYSKIFGFVKFTGTLKKSGDFYNVEVGGTKTGSLFNPVSVDEKLFNKVVDVEGYYVGLAGGKFQNVVITSINANDAKKYFSVENASLNVVASAKTATVKINSNGAWTAQAVTEGCSVSAANGSGDAELTLSFPENTSNEAAKTYEFKIATAEAEIVNKDKEILVKVIQAKVAAPGESVVTLEWKVIAKDMTTDNAAKTPLVVGDITFEFAQGSHGSLSPRTWSGNTELRAYKGNTITVKGSAAGVKISSIVFDKTVGLTPDCGSLTDKTWTGDSNAVLFTVSGEGTQKIKSFTITYTK